MNLTGKVAFLTGAGRGLGAGVALALARAGAYVLATDVDAVELANVAAAGTGSAGYLDTAQLDVTDMAGIQQRLATLSTRRARLDIVIHCAAILPLLPFADAPVELWQRELAINLTSFMAITQLVWPQMVGQGGGHLIAIASGASQHGFANEAAYCASKHGLEGFIKALAFEASPHGISVNSVGPGKLLKPTGMSHDAYQAVPVATRATWADPIALGEAFVWLASQTPGRFNGLRFDAGPIVDTMASEGPEFYIAPEKLTLYPEEFVARQRWFASQQAG